MKSLEILGVPILPTAVTLIGVCLSIDGARKIDTIEGIAEVIVGRTCDLADGALARALGQTSDPGAIADAFSDKAAGLAILASEWKKDIAPKPALAAMFIQNTANGIATYWAKRKNPNMELSRSKDGARAMFMQNVAVGAYAIGNVLKETDPVRARQHRTLGHVATGVGVGYFGVKATSGYFKRAVSA